MRLLAVSIGCACVLHGLPARAAYPQDISVIGDFQYHSDFVTPGSGNDRLVLSEMEFAIQGFLTPAARVDVFLGMHPSGTHPGSLELDAEDVYLTLFDTRSRNSLRLGKFKPTFGKLNRLHPEQWFSVDRPIVLARLLGDEGLNDFGLEGSLAAGRPESGQLRLDAAVLNTGNPVATPGAGTSGKAGSARVGLLYAPEPEVSLDSGLSLLGGAVPGAAAFDVSGLGGADLTWRWRPDDESALTISTEAMALRSVLPDGSAVFPSGLYAVADYQFATSHNAGFRLDHAWSASNLGRFEQAASVHYGFVPGESQRLKLQLTRGWTYASGFATAPGADWRFLAQVLFSLGTHRHAVGY